MIFQKLIADHRKAGSQIFWLAYLDVKKTYSGAVLGWAWAVIKPTVMIAVYWFVLSRGLRAGNTIQGVEFFPWLVVGMIPWLFIKDMLSSSTRLFKKYKYLVSKIKFPVSTIPTFISISNLFIHLILLVVGFMIVLIGHGNIPIQVVQLPLLTALMVVIMISWSYIIGPVATISKDFANLVNTFTQTLFWISGVLYSVQSLGDGLAKSILLLNPFNYIIEGYRKSLLYGEWFYTDTGALSKFLVTLLLMMIIGMYVYKRAYSVMVDSL